MATVSLYKWYYIAPSATVATFVYGFAPTQHGVFDARPINIGKSGTAFTPVFDIKLTQDETFIHVDGSYAREISIQNLAGFNATGAELFFSFL